MKRQLGNPRFHQFVCQSPDGPIPYWESCDLDATHHSGPDGLGQCMTNYYSYGKYEQRRGLGREVRNLVRRAKYAWMKETGTLPPRRKKKPRRRRS